MIPTLRTSCAILAHSRTIQQKVAVPTIHSYVNLAIDAHGDMSMHIQMPATHESNTDGCIIRCLRRIHRMPCRSASYEIVGHTFGTNLGKKTHILQHSVRYCQVSLLRIIQVSLLRNSWSHFCDKSLEKPTYYKTLSVFVTLTAYAHFLWYQSNRGHKTNSSNVYCPIHRTHAP